MLLSVLIEFCIRNSHAEIISLASVLFPTNGRIRDVIVHRALGEGEVGQVLNCEHCFDGIPVTANECHAADNGERGDTRMHLRRTAVEIEVVVIHGFGLVGGKGCCWSTLRSPTYQPIHQLVAVANLENHLQNILILTIRPKEPLLSS